MMSRMSLQQPLQLSKKIAIIGAGASGLLCSIILARLGFSVVVFEKNHKLGRKIFTTGNGRCNISNENISLSNFYTTDGNFIKYPLEQFNYNTFQKFFQNLGLELISKEKGRVYPITLQSSSVVDILVYEARRLNVQFLIDTEITKINFNNNQFILNNTTKFDKLIVSTGSSAMPKLGSSDSGYKFAKEFGHNIIEPFASLVQLKSSNSKIAELSGVKIDSKIELEINKEYVTNSSGDLLFTNYGVSGNAILDISRDASYALSLGSDVNLKIDIFPIFSKDILVSKLSQRLKNSQNKDKYFWLEGFIHPKLIKYLIDNCGINQNKKNANELNKKDIMSLVYFIKNMKINIYDTKGFDTAEVSAGGIDVSEIESKTMQSKLKKGLYFIGEVLDVDGQCGGYNLHWAWASAYVCANSMCERR